MSLSDINDVIKQFPLLEFDSSKGDFFGNLNIDEFDFYKVRILVGNFPLFFPKVLEEGERIPRKPSRHINNDGTLCFCTLAKEKILLRKNIRTIPDFINLILVPFLTNNSFYEINKTYKNGEYSHGVIGIIEGYMDILNIYDEKLLCSTLQSRLKNKKYNRNDYCFCGSKIKIKNCHLNNYEDLYLLNSETIRDDIKTIIMNK